MFKPISREEYLVLAEVGAKVCAFSDLAEFRAWSGDPKWIDDVRYAPSTIELAHRYPDRYKNFYAVLSDAEQEQD